jgi:hypothetical protein
MTANNIQFTKIEIQIAKYLFKHYKDSYNARQLARLLDINHAHANKLCSQLARKNLLTKKDIGNAVYFSYNYDSKLALNFMGYVLSIEDFPNWLAVAQHNLDKFKPYIQLGLVFGSSIKRKDYNDIDVLLVFEKDNIREINQKKQEIMGSEQIQQPIRYVDITEKDIVSNKDDKIFYSIISDSLIFYNPEKYVEVIRKCRR